MKTIIVDKDNCITVPKGYEYEGKIYEEDTLIKVANKYNSPPGTNVYKYLVKRVNKSNVLPSHEYNSFYNFPFYNLPTITHPLFLVGKEVVVQKYYNKPLLTVKYCPLEKKLVYGDRINFYKKIDFPFPSATDYFEQYPEYVFFGSLSDTEKSFVLYDAYHLINRKWAKPDFIEKYKAYRYFTGRLDSLETLKNIGKCVVRCLKPFYTGIFYGS